MTGKYALSFYQIFFDQSQYAAKTAEADPVDAKKRQQQMWFQRRYSSISKMLDGLGDDIGNLAEVKKYRYMSYRYKSGGE